VFGEIPESQEYSDAYVFTPDGEEPRPARPDESYHHLSVKNLQNGEFRLVLTGTTNSSYSVLVFIGQEDDPNEPPSYSFSGTITTGQQIEHVINTAAPHLRIRKHNQKVELSWRSATPEFHLEESLFIVPSSWAPVLLPVVSSNGQSTVTMDLPISSRYYRLRR